MDSGLVVGDVGRQAVHSWGNGNTSALSTKAAAVESGRTGREAGGIPLSAKRVAAIVAGNGAHEPRVGDEEDGEEEDEEGEEEDEE